METEGLEGAVKAVQEMAQHAVGVSKLTFSIRGEDCEVGLDIPAVLLQKGDQQARAYSSAAFFTSSAEMSKVRLAQATGPDVREGTAQLQALDSLIAHANRFKGPVSAIWADAAARRIVVVLDYHGEGHDGATGWARHRGVYECPLSEAWIAWGAGKEVIADQEDFAAFLDAHDRELSGGQLPNGRPAVDPAALITLASELETYRDLKVKRTREPNTQRFKLAYSDETGFKGDVSPPSSFLIWIPVFQDGKQQLLEVRLTAVADKEGAARFGYRIHAAGDVLRDAFNALCRRVAAETELPLFIGTPERVS